MSPFDSRVIHVQMIKRLRLCGKADISKSSFYFDFSDAESFRHEWFADREARKKEDRTATLYTVMHRND